MDEMGCLVPVDHKDRREILEQQALKVSLAQGGGKLAVQVPQEMQLERILRRVSSMLSLQLSLSIHRLALNKA